MELVPEAGRCSRVKARCRRLFGEARAVVRPNGRFLVVATPDRSTSAHTVSERVSSKWSRSQVCRPVSELRSAVARAVPRLTPVMDLAIRRICGRAPARPRE